MDFLHAVLFAILQGATELFPVSSLGHAVIVPALFKWKVDEGSDAFLPFLVMLHLGTAIGMLVYFWRDWAAMLGGVLGKGVEREISDQRSLVLKLVAATVPAVIVGVIVKKPVQHLFASPLVACIFLIANAGLLLLGEFLRSRGSKPRDYDEAAVLRLEPLLLAGAQATELGLMRGLRQEFGHEAHIAVTAAGNGVFAMAARAAREDEVAEAMHRRMAEIAPARLTGTRPGILAMFIEDTDQLEWRVLRDQLRLEGAARQFLTRAEARSVVAVTCVSRLEMLGGVPPHAAENGELRFRSPGHPDARAPALAPAVAAFT